MSNLRGHCIRLHSTYVATAAAAGSNIPICRLLLMYAGSIRFELQTQIRKIHPSDLRGHCSALYKTLCSCRLFYYYSTDSKNMKYMPSLQSFKLQILCTQLLALIATKRVRLEAREAGFLVTVITQGSAHATFQNDIKKSHIF